MNRKIMDGLSYGFYFIIICLLLLIFYLIFFKQSTPKKNDDKVDDDNPEQVIIENIKLNRENISLDIGGSFDLKVTLTPSNGDEVITYESTDSSVATVDENGKIAAVGAGTANIKVTVEGTNLISECVVTVSDKIIMAQELFVPNTTVNIKVGETHKLDVTVIPSNTVDKSLSFTSVNTQVLSVDENGVVTGLKAGRSKILIQAKTNPNVQLNVTFVVE